jgi:hypothetical protein
MATFDFLKHKTYLMLFIVAQFFIMQSQYKAYVDNTTMLKLGKEAIVTNIYVRETQQMRHRTKEIFFDYFNADVNKIIRGYDADVPDIQNIENTTLLKVLYTTDSANGFTHTKMRMFPTFRTSKIQHCSKFFTPPIVPMVLHTLKCMIMSSHISNPLISSSRLYFCLSCSVWVF